MPENDRTPHHEAMDEDTTVCRYCGLPLGTNDEVFYPACVEAPHEDQERRPTVAERTYYPQG